nr:sulfatase [uncultured Sediminibacterium sp.]
MFRAILLGIICCLCFSLVIAQKNTVKPNILIILADDLGWADLSCYGSSFYETPHLDKLAKEGTRFTQFYAASPVCSPTRASVLTGKYPNKTGVTDWITGRQAGGKAKPYERLIGPETAYQLSSEEKTIAQYALQNGYTTFFAGKWHLGETENDWPESFGFQTNKGGWSKGSPTGRMNDSTGGFFVPYKNPRLSDGPTGEYLTDRLTNECLNFLDQQKDQPFFLFYSLYAVHNPLQAPDSLIKKYKVKQQTLGLTPAQRFAKDEPWMQNENEWKRRLVQDHPVYAAMMENMDQNIGKILAKLEQLGLDKNTLIIFTSDNGGLSTAEGSPTSNAPLRAGKGWLYEGGIRVPMIMRWQGKVPENKEIDWPAISNDIYPTVAGIMNARYKTESAIDGIDLLQLMQRKKSDRTLFWHYPHYSNQGGKPGSAIRKGHYKMVYDYETDSMELFDLSKDPYEKENIIAKEQDLAIDMKKELFQWLQKTKSAFPKKNPLYQE